jgi:hypothetical protein
MLLCAAAVAGLPALVTAPAVAAPQPSADQTELVSTAIGDPITRSEVMARAKTWIEEVVPYDMHSNHSSGWRKDCSGFVSMAWNLSKPGLSTVTLPNISHPITKDELLPGDILLDGGPGTEGSNGHVRIFGGWLDGAHSRYWVYEQTPPHTVYREYIWAGTVAEFPPYRYNNIIEDSAPNPTSVQSSRAVYQPNTGVTEVFARSANNKLVHT